MEMEGNIVLIGAPGCGKTTVGKILAKRLKIVQFDLDEYIEKKQNMTINDIFKNGEDYFRKLETQALQEIVGIPGCKVISTGGGTVKLNSNIELLKQNSTIFFINRPLLLIAYDINMASRPLLADGVSRLFEIYQERYPLYKKYCDFEIDNSGMPEEAVDRIMANLSIS